MTVQPADQPVQPECPGALDEADLDDVDVKDED